VTVERLQAQDATLWCAQAQDAPLQIGALCLFEAAPLLDDSGALRVDDLCRHVERGLAELPRFRTRLASVAVGQGLVWVDDEDFDITNHVRIAVLPEPGGDAELRDFVSRLIEAPLDQRRPLWEIWVVAGVAAGRIAVVPKVSHVMADGMAVLEFALSLLDSEPHAPVDEPPPEWSPRPTPSDASLAYDELVERVRMPIELARGLVASLSRPDRLVGRVLELGRVGASSASIAPPLPITRPVGARRDFGWTRLPIDDLLALKRAREVTLNDVVLTVVAGALRRYLQRHDASINVSPRVLVPVSTHVRAGEEIENRFTLMIAELPVAVADPVERLHRVHDDMERHKASAQTDLGPLLFTLGAMLPPALLQLVGPALLERQPFVNLAVTNLPGTRDPMYLLGSRLLELFPYVSVTGNIAVIIAVLSYEDGLGVGITVDADVVEDVDDLVLDIEQAVRSLVDAAR
jgi:diacylglycerol O-acyltransferase / wax synthase